MNDLSDTVNAYVAAWNETNERERARLLARAWADNAATYVDPTVDASGHAEISENMANVQAGFPDHDFRRCSDIDEHNDRFRFGWEIVDPDGNIVVDGVDYGIVSEDKRLRSVAGFFGLAPEKTT